MLSAKKGGINVRLLVSVAFFVATITVVLSAASVGGRTRCGETNQLPDGFGLTKATPHQVKGASRPLARCGKLPDPSGSVQEEWGVRYDGPGHDIDVANAIAVDSSGSVYVTGGSHGGAGIGLRGYDYATIKYDTSGRRQWVARYNGPGNNYDEAHALVVDDSGNVYVTGESYGGVETGVDYATIKYDSSGNQLWVKRYNNETTNGDDIATAIAIDASGNVYLTGRSVDSLTGDDYATVK